MHLNIRSLQKNISQLRDLLSLIDNTIIGLGETWLRSDNVLLYEVSEYTSTHVTTPSKKGGCVCHYMSIVHLSILYYQK